EPRDGELHLPVDALHRDVARSPSDLHAAVDAFDGDGPFDLAHVDGAVDALRQKLDAARHDERHFLFDVSAAAPEPAPEAAPARVLATHDEAGGRALHVDLAVFERIG